MLHGGSKVITRPLHPVQCTCTWRAYVARGFKGHYSTFEPRAMYMYVEGLCCTGVQRSLLALFSDLCIQAVFPPG